MVLNTGLFFSFAWLLSVTDIVIHMLANRDNVLFSILLQFLGADSIYIGFFWYFRFVRFFVCFFDILLLDGKKKKESTNKDQNERFKFGLKKQLFNDYLFEILQAINFFFHP